MTARIVLVEDDAWLSELYADKLLAAGYRVQCALNLEAAWQFFMQNKPVGAVVLDIMLGEYNGLQLLHELQTQTRHAQVPVIIQSNIARAVDLPQEVWQAYGVVDYLHKDTHRPRDLLRAVQRVCPL